MHRAMMERYAERDRLAYFKLNQAIHSGIVALSDNATLSWTHEVIQAREVGLNLRQRLGHDRRAVGRGLLELLGQEVHVQEDGVQSDMIRVQGNAGGNNPLKALALRIKEAP